MEDSERNEMPAITYLLSQGQLIHKLLEGRNRSEAVEGFVLGPYRTFQIAVADLETATSVGFGALKDADPLKKTKAEREAIDAGIPVIVPVEDTADLMLRSNIDVERAAANM